MSKATEESNVVPFVQPGLPAHLKDKGGLGNEDVKAGDLAIPRLSLLQKLSPQLDRGSPDYIAEAADGMYYNSVTNELMESLYVVNVMYRRTVAAFKKRDLGGGFAGNHPDKAAAIAKLEADGLDPSHYDLTDTGNHYLLVLDGEGKAKSPVIFSMSGSKMRVSNAWNSKIVSVAEDSPRFATVWELSSVAQSNSSGSWFNTKVDYLGFASEDLFEHAQELYAQFSEQ